MTTKYKSNTAELIAIYRLEFYKKQKNWKFCHDVCKKVDPKPEPQPEPQADPQPEPAKDIKSDFNKTYSVDADLDTNNASPLNHAFLETDNVAKYPAEFPPDSNDGTVWPEHFMEQHYKAPAQEQDLKWEPERCSPEWVPREAWRPPASPPALWRDAPQEVLMEGGQEFYEQQDYNANCAGVGVGVGLGVGVDWQARTHAWALRAAHADPPDEGEAAGELLRAADRWLHHDRGHHEASLESFMLGAAAAPHSSELDLLACSGSECSLTASCVSTLSGSQLAARVGRHAAALRLLLREARVRDQLGNSRQSLEEPTRDPGPCPPPPHSPLQRQDTFVKQPCVKDSFVAGSFKASPESVTGKGRGRLRVRPGVIGIGMGRPYRL